MKTQQLHRLVTIVLSIGLAFLLFTAPLVFSQAGPARENFGPLRSPSSLYQDQTRPLQIEQNALSAPLNKVATAADEWQLYPFYGGEMMSMAMSPTNKDIVYVGTRDAGVFKTTNGGISWQPKRNGLTFWPINVLTVDPANENVLYAGTEYAGIWKSSDGGDSWLQVHNGVLKGYSWVVRDIAIDHQNTQIIYVGYYEPYYGGHILKTVNGGASWEYKDSGLPKDGDGDADMIYSLAIDPNNHLTLYAGTWGDGAFRTTDGGESWQAINCGIPDDLGYKYAYVHSFAFDPHHANRLCSILDDEYYIFNADNCWEKISTDNRVDHHIKFHPTDDTIMYSYGGFFHISSDGGVTWGYAEDNIDNVNDIVFHNDFPDTIYAATDWYGDEWDGYRSGGVYKTTDGATTWNEMTQGITARVISSVGIDPQNSDFIYVIVTQIFDQVLLKSQDGGQTWQTGYYHFSPTTIDFITIDPQNPGQLYAGGWSGDFYFSNDDGQTFHTINEIRNPTGITFDPENPNTIYVGTIDDGIYKSTDSGSTWTQKNNGLPTDPYDGSIWVDSVAVDPNNSSVIWAGMNVREGIYKSENGGESWVLKGLDNDFDAHKILSIAINPDNSDVIFAGTGTSGPGSIYRTTNGGATWEQKITDIGWVYKIAYDPRNSNWIYAATEGYGVLRSRDGGESWHDYNNGIFYPVLYSLSITQEDPPLLVTGSYGSGLYWIHPLENLPPNTPSTPVPADGTGDVPTNQVLGWQGGDPDGDPVTYTVAFGASDPPPPVATTKETSYTPTLEKDKTCYWRITASDGISESVGAVWSFETVANQAPDLPVALVPADGANGVALDQALSWQGGDPDGDPVTYTVAFGASDPPPPIATTTETSYTPTLEKNKTYYWRITASDGVSTTVGDMWRFTTTEQTYVYLPLVSRALAPQRAVHLQR